MGEIIMGLLEKALAEEIKMTEYLYYNLYEKGNKVYEKK